MCIMIMNNIVLGTILFIIIIHITHRTEHCCLLFENKSAPSSLMLILHYTHTHSLGGKFCRYVCVCVCVCVCVSPQCWG